MNTSTFTQQDVINAQLNAKIDIQNTKIDAFIEEMKNFKDEMREFKREVRENTAEMRNIGKHVQNITIAAMVGIGAMALSGGAVAVAVVYSIFNSAVK